IPRSGVRNNETCDAAETEMAAARKTARHGGRADVGFMVGNYFKFRLARQPLCSTRRRRIEHSATPARAATRRSAAWRAGWGGGFMVGNYFKFRLARQPLCSTRRRRIE